MGAEMAETFYSARAEAMRIERLWGIKEVAEFLGLSVGTVYHMVSEGRIPCVRLSARCLRFQPSEITEWVQQKSEKGDVK